MKMKGDAKGKKDNSTELEELSHRPAGTFSLLLLLASWAGLTEDFLQFKLGTHWTCFLLTCH